MSKNLQFKYYYNINNIQPPKARHDIDVQKGLSGFRRQIHASDKAQVSRSKLNIGNWRSFRRESCQKVDTTITEINSRKSAKRTSDQSLRFRAVLVSIIATPVENSAIFQGFGTWSPSALYIPCSDGPISTTTDKQ